MSVNLQFQLTARELFDARRLIMRRARMRYLRLRQFVAWLIFVGLAILSDFTLPVQRECFSRQPTAPNRSCHSQFTHFILPGLVILGCIWFYFFRLVIKKPVMHSPLPSSLLIRSW